MRILLWYWGRRGGGAQFALCLGRALAETPGVTLGFSLAERNELLREFRGTGVPVDAVPTFAGAAGALLGLARIPALRRRLVAQARAMRAELVLSAMPHVWTPLVAPALTRAGLAYVPVIHDAEPHPGDPSLAWAWRLDRELGAARAAIVLSEAVAGRLAERRPGLPLIRLPLGAHLPGAQLPGEAVPDGEGREFLFFGRLRAYKGLDLLRDAFRLVQARHPGARLRVVGEGDAEACAPGLAALPGVTVEARWASEAEMARLVAGARAVVLPYREASQSGVAPLALLLGVPVVATPVGALPEQAGHEVSGLVAAAVTPEALAEAMSRMMEDATRARLAEGARARGAGLGDWRGQAARLLDGLREAGIGERAR